MRETLIKANLTLQAIYFFFIRKNPFKFWWGLFQAWMTAFATAST